MTCTLQKRKLSTIFYVTLGLEIFCGVLYAYLGNDTPRVVGNAAYIIGTLAESELRFIRVLSLVKDGSTDSNKILAHLTRMLTFDDSESVLNAAGTIGTLAESDECREWILSENCLPNTLEHIMFWLDPNLPQLIKDKFGSVNPTTAPFGKRQSDGQINVCHACVGDTGCNHGVCWVLTDRLFDLVDDINNLRCPAWWFFRRWHVFYKVCGPKGIPCMKSDCDRCEPCTV